ncbi:MAG: N-acetylmuramoyl-L-alanine amidase [Sedimentisphaerales bacterium]|jgi:N-acetylmuramoyl-L-alanine amidase|nr:N-acetylmuramoyl-L-alanine amidase [Sedimentisphaerales bacterium]
MRSLYRKGHVNLEAAGQGWLTGLILCVTILIVGCEQPLQTPPSLSQTGQDRLIPINDLARELNMSVAEVDKTFVKLKDRKNVVLIFTHHDGRIFVNSKECGPAGPVQQAGGNILVDRGIVSRIRGYIASSPVIDTVEQGDGPVGQWTVVLDPGHGGKDPGAISPLGFCEKEVNLQVAQRLAAVLRRMGIRVIMTRDTDVFLELEERAAIANRNKADLFVSIHADSAPSRTLSGYTIYTARSAGDRSRWAASTIAEAMKATGIESNGVRQADYRVLVNTNCPAVLVEVGYISNYYEAARLADPFVQQRLAQAIAEGLVRCMGK